MKAYTYIKKGVFALTDKPKPTILEPTDAIVRTTLSSICSSDLHIKHGCVPRAVLGITLGHEMVGIVEEIGPEVKNVKVGDRVTVNVETFCGECFFCQHGYVNNCTSPHGGWALGCRIDGGQTEYVRVPLATQRSRSFSALYFAIVILFPKVLQETPRRRPRRAGIPSTPFLSRCL